MDARGRLPSSPASPTGAELSRALVEVAQESGQRRRAAFERLFAYYAPRLKAYFQRLGAPPTQADDLAQETLLLLWRKAGLFDPAKASASTWVFTLARNLRIDALRRERHPTAAAVEGEHAVAAAVMDAWHDAAPDPEQVLSVAEIEARLRQALATLPEEQRRAVLLSYYEDKSHSTIERELRIPLGTVKARLRLAIVRLRNALDGGGGTRP